MALDKLVDSTQLDSNLTSVANAIRAKSGGTGQLAFPAGFVSEIGNISGGGGITPTGTKEITITANGTTTEDVTAYASVLISTNVPSSGGNSIYSGTFTPAENTLGPTFDIGADFTHFVVFADTNPSASDNVKKFFAAVCDFSRAGNDVITIASNNTGSALIGGFYAYKWFAKNGTTVRCTNTGTSGQTGAGYWVGGVTYNWFAW